MDEDTRKHLDYVQAIITRMNSNSFQIKNMTVVILTAMFALFAATPKIILLFIAVFPIIIFWFLDAYYLQQERKFRAMYADIAGLTNLIEIKPYEMSIEKYTGNKCSYVEAFISITMKLFYIPILVITIAVTVILYNVTGIQIF